VTAQLKALQDLLADNEKSSFLQAAHAYPTESFPWNEENMLGLLLRKRLEPDMVTWLENARTRGAALSDSAQTGGEPATSMAGGNWDELWNWAGPAANDIVREVYMGGGSDDGSDDGSEEDEGSEEEVEVEVEVEVDEDGEEVKEVKHEAPVLEQPPIVETPPLPLQSIMRFANLAGPLP
jgi:mediator of RNA polymerase II transcription subunit 8